MAQDAQSVARRDNTIGAMNEHVALADEQLIALAVADDARGVQAFFGLWRRHRGFVRTFCTRRLNGVHEAEEVTHNVAMKACGALSHFEHRRGFAPRWLRLVLSSQPSLRSSSYADSASMHWPLKVELVRVLPKEFTTGLSLISRPANLASQWLLPVLAGLASRRSKRRCIRCLNSSRCWRKPAERFRFSLVSSSSHRCISSSVSRFQRPLRSASPSPSRCGARTHWSRSIYSPTHSIGFSQRSHP
ncbi:MAG: hypothetical protein ACI9DC_004291 [Gammaproteobacteria bacterium]|jgi:hypothetical protein